MGKLVWADEFNVEGAPDPSKWTMQTGGHGWGNNELQHYTDRTGESEANAYIRDGRLHIVLRREDMGERRYTSARLSTSGKASWQYGRIEVSAKLPVGAGTWPAIWMLGDSIKEQGWPDCGEIDIMEHVGRDQDVIHHSLHSRLYNHKVNTQITEVRRHEGVSSGFHLYSIDWREDEITFLYDNEPVVTYRKGGDGHDESSEGWPFNAPHFLLLNLAYGGFFGGEPEDACLPQTLEIDYVRVYEPEREDG